MKTVAVIGLGQFGYQLAVNLSQKGFDVLAIDKEVEEVSEIKDLVHQAVILDSTDEKAMRAVHVDGVDKAVVAIGSNVQSSLLTTALLQRMNIEEIYVRADNGTFKSDWVRVNMHTEPEYFEAFKQVDVYAFGLVMWEITRRCVAEGKPGGSVL